VIIDRGHATDKRDHTVVNKIIIRFADGRIMKGTTEDFFPNKISFHIQDKESGELINIGIKDLKAVFFVKSFDGDSSYREKADAERCGLGRKIRVSFKDGEVIVGYTQGYSRDRAGFILFPADQDSNNEKVFVISSATDSIDFVI